MKLEGTIKRQTQANLSKIIAEDWRTEHPSVRRLYEARAEEHKRRLPVEQNSPGERDSGLGFSSVLLLRCAFA
jgi:hypothetical protein